MVARLIIFGLVIALVLATAFIACSDKLAFPKLPTPVYGGVDTSYIQINPVWNEAGGIPYSHPHGIHIGYDRFIYICDTENDRVVKLDQLGNLVESYAITHPVAVTQDRGLDLLAVCGDYYEITVIDDSTSDTTWYGNSVYRRSYRYGTEFEPVFTDSNVIDIYVFPPGVTISVRAEYWGIAASELPDKSYWLADYLRDRILLLDANDDPGSRPFIPSGIGIGLAESPWSLYAFEIVGENYLAYAQASANLGVQILSLPAGVPIYADTVNGLPDLVRISASVRKWVAVDELLNYYVLLERLSPLTGYNHHLIKYDRYGNEILRFGTSGSGERQFDRPRGLAYKDGILYVADTFNDRITRFQLTTELRE